MRIIGITGGIGSGKSYVSRILTQQFGIPVYDCDTEAKRLNNQSPQIRQALTTLLGTEVYGPDGMLRKDILAAYLFQAAENQQRINAIIHPVVRQDFQAWCQRQQCPTMALESAILFESGFDNLADVILNVTAPLPLRIQRTVERDHTTAQQVENRIRLQLSDEVRCQRSHHIIHNDGRDLIPQLSAIVNTYAENK